MRNLKSVVCASFFSAALLAVPMASEAAIFNLTSDHCTGSGGCLGNNASLGTVTVTSPSTGTLIFSISLSVAGSTIVNTGFDASFGFNLVGNPSITYSGLTAGFTIPGGNPQSAGSLHMDGTGFFEYGVLWGTQGGGAGTPGPLNFTVTGSGLTLGSLEQNASAQFFSLDVFSGATGNTGAVDASICTTNCGDIRVPEPGPLALLAIGMFALVGTRKWAGRKQ
jgi:hypothetical protein